MLNLSFEVSECKPLVWGHAVGWVRKAADQDHSGAQYILGAWYLEVGAYTRSLQSST